LRLEPAQLDVAVFSRYLDQAKQARGEGDPESAIRLLDAAMGLWRGTPLGAVPGPYAQLERLRLNELRALACEQRAEAMLATGRTMDVVADLTALADEYPLRERVRVLLMLALCRGGRQAEALKVFHAIRSLLAEELGVDPGPELQDLYEQILRSDRKIVSATDVPVVRGDGKAAIVPAQLPRDVSAFTGRHSELTELSGLVSGMCSQAREMPIVAITGTGGVGKTALAVHFAHRVSSKFSDGQLYVDLRGFNVSQAPMTTCEALHHLLRSLGVDEAHVPDGVDQQVGLYRSLLANRRMLVVLDNARNPDQVRPCSQVTRQWCW